LVAKQEQIPKKKHKLIKCCYCLSAPQLRACSLGGVLQKKKSQIFFTEGVPLELRVLHILNYSTQSPHNIAMASQGLKKPVCMQSELGYFRLSN